MRISRFSSLALALLLASTAHAQQFLKQSTAAQAIKLCGFVDSTDGNTEESGLTIANTDIKISKNGGSFGNKNSGGATYDAVGCYTVTLDATDTNTVGRLDIAVHASGALPVYARYQVLEEAVNDAFYAASAPGYVANAPVNVAQFGGANGTFASGRPEVNTTHWTGQDIASGTGPLPALGVIDRGTAQSAASGNIRLRSAATFSDDEVNGATALVYSATTGAGQSGLVSDYAGSTDTASLATNWTTTPTGTIRYELYGTAASSGGGGGLDAAGVRSAIGLASANLDTQLSGIQSDTDNIQTRLPTSLVSGRMDSSTGAMASGVLTATAIASDAITAAKVASDVGTEIGTATWGIGSRTLTAGTNIALAKGTGITGFNDLDAAGIRTALGMSSANLDTQLSGLSSAVAVIDGIVDQLLVGVNISKINGKTLTGDGSSNPFDVVP